MELLGCLQLCVLTRVMIRIWHKFQASRSCLYRKYDMIQLDLNRITLESIIAIQFLEPL